MSYNWAIEWLPDGFWLQIVFSGETHVYIVGRKHLGSFIGAIESDDVPAEIVDEIFEHMEFQLGSMFTLSRKVVEHGSITWAETAKLYFMSQVWPEPSIRW